MSSLSSLEIATGNCSESHHGDSGPADTPVLEVRELRKQFIQGSVVAVDKVSFEVRRAEILAILGPSGCGKTTTLRIIAGLEEPDSGDVFVHGRSVLGFPPHRRDIGLVFQDLAIFPHKTVFENVAFGLRMKKVQKGKIRQRVDEILEVVELPAKQFANRLPRTLSGGQKQRVALARTLVMQPTIVLFDEPMVSLDRRLRDRMVVEVRQIQKRLKLPAIYVTHDQESASFFSDRIAVMEAGRIVQTGTPLEIYRNPRSKFVANFIGDSNFLKGRVVSKDEFGTRVDLFGEIITFGSQDVKPGDEVTIAIRPENLRLSLARTNLSLFQARLTSWQFNAGMFLYRVMREDGTEAIVRSLSDEFSATVGSETWLEADSESIRFLKG